MKKFLAPATAIILVLAAAAGGALALTGGGDDDDDAAVRESADQQRCAADATACDDPNSTDEGENGGSALGVCVEGVPDCVDTVVNDGDGDPAGSCLAGTTCDDTPGYDEPITSDPNSGDGIDPSECNAVHNIDACQEQAIALAIEDLVARTGAEPVLVSAEYSEWPDTSLGNPQGEMFYAQVITPGYKIILEAGGAQYEYHTDLAGNFTLLD